MSGPYPGDGTTYDLQYLPGSEFVHWSTGHYLVVFSYWSYHYRPGPATIDGISETMEGSDVSDIAHVGDRMFAARSVGHVNRVIYMQVVGVTPGSIVADTWVWDKD